MSEVVIVGAGPAGATLALLLAQRGISVKLIEAARNFQRTFRGEGLMPSGLGALEQMGLSDLIEKIPHRSLDAWEFWINKRLLFRVNEPLEVETKPCTLIAQPAFLDAVIAEASIYPHFEFIQGCAVKDLIWQNNRVSGVKLTDERYIAADLVIGTDGRNSLVRTKAGISIEKKSQSFNILWFKLESPTYFSPESIFYSIVQDQQAFGAFRSSEGNLQIGWMLRTQEANLQTEIEKQRDWVNILASASPSWLAEHLKTYGDRLERPVLLTVVAGYCSQWYKPGVILLGDAAHPMSPLRAQGINMALRDVIVAANHLVPLLKVNASADNLDKALSEIQAEREPEILLAQKLQAQEAAQAEKLNHSALLRWAVGQFGTLLKFPIRLAWLRRQRSLRQGITSVKLKV